MKWAARSTRRATAWLGRLLTTFASQELKRDRETHWAGCEIRGSCRDAVLVHLFIVFLQSPFLQRVRGRHTPQRTFPPPHPTHLRVYRFFRVDESFRAGTRAGLTRFRRGVLRAFWDLKAENGVFFRTEVFLEAILSTSKVSGVGF